MNHEASTFTIAPLTESKIDEASRLLSLACEFDRAHFVAREKLFGEGAPGGEEGGEGEKRDAGDAAHSFAGAVTQTLGAFQGHSLVGVAAVSDRWIRLLAVLPEQRGRGIGSALLDACLAQIARHSPKARIMDQPGNYLSPGVDKRNTKTIAWLEERGFSACGSACNLLIRLQGNPRVSARRLEDRVAVARVAGYEICRITAQQIEPTAIMVERDFSVGWAFEIRRAAANAPAGVFLALVQETRELVAFAAHDGNNHGLGSFGPAGTLDAHQGKGLGAALLLSCLLDIRDAGHTHAEVAWIGPRAFYDKIAGIESERHFCAMTKTLTQGNDND